MSTSTSCRILGCRWQYSADDQVLRRCCVRGCGNQAAHRFRRSEDAARLASYLGTDDPQPFDEPLARVRSAVSTAVSAVLPGAAAAAPLSVASTSGTNTTQAAASAAASTCFFIERELQGRGSTCAWQAVFMVKTAYVITLTAQ